MLSASRCCEHMGRSQGKMDCQRLLFKWTLGSAAWLKRMNVGKRPSHRNDTLFLLSKHKSQNQKRKKKTQGKTQRGKQASIDPLGKIGQICAYLEKRR